MLVDLLRLTIGCLVGHLLHRLLLLAWQPRVRLRVHGLLWLVRPVREHPEEHQPHQSEERISDQLAAISKVGSLEVEVVVEGPARSAL